MIFPLELLRILIILTITVVKFQIKQSVDSRIGSSSAVDQKITL